MKTKRVEMRFYLDIPYETHRDVREVVRDAMTRTLLEFSEYEPVIDPFQWRELTEDDNTKYEYFNAYEEE